MKRSVLFFGLLFLSISAISQSPGSITLYGKIFSDTDPSLSNVHIININNRTGTITNDEGLYRLSAAGQDTIRFSSIGYKTTYLIIPVSAESYFHRNILLQTDTLNLSEIIIHPYPSDLSSLKREFLVLKTDPEPQVDLHFEDVPITVPFDGAMVIKGPFTALYEAVSRHEKILKKYQILIGQDRINLLVAKRYNLAIVKKITGLKEEQEIIRFMEFCNLEPEFVLRVNDYELYCVIKECYRRFRADGN